MEPVFRAAVDELKSNKPMVVATVVKTSGSTPQKPGAKLLVRADGSGVGTLGGGCVEGDIWFAAKQILKRGGGAEMRDYVLNEDLAAQDGLVCGGTMYFLIDPIRSSEQYSQLAGEVVKAYEGGTPVAIVNVMKAAGGSALPVGAKMLVRENGSTVGSLGNAEFEDRATHRARALMALGKNEYVNDDPSGHEYYIEAYTTPPTLVVAGAGHVSKALAPIAKSVGMRLFVFDDREEFANPQRFPEADIVRVGDFENGFSELPINTNSFIIIATRGHRHDFTATAAALKTPATFIGLLGSKRKSILIFEELMRHGVELAEIRRVRSPVGLDIGGRTPEEIAVSIIAEILAFRLGGHGGPMQLSDAMLEKARQRVEKELAGQPKPEPAIAD